MKKSKMIATIISAVVIVVGVFAVVYNFVIIYNADLKIFNYKSTDGTVSTVQSSYIDGKYLYNAVYSYKVDSMFYTCKSGLSEHEDDFTIGETAKVKYNPKVPSSAIIQEVDRTMNYLYLGISCIILIIGIKIFDKQLKIK